MMGNNCYIYRHIRLDKNEVFYIGIGTGKSYGRSISKRNRNSHWLRIVEQSLYEVEIIADLLTWEEAAIKEIEFILLYGRRDLKTGTLVNMCDGGAGGSHGRIISDETRKAISNSNKGHKYNVGRKASEAAKKAMSLAGMGRVVTEATRQKLREINTGKKLSVEHCRKMGEYSKLKKNMLGKNHTEEAKIKIGLAQKGKIETDETKLKKSLSHIGKKHSPEVINKMREARLKYYQKIKE